MSITVPSELCLESLFIDFEGLKKLAGGLTCVSLSIVSCLCDAFIEVILKKGSSRWLTMSRISIAVVSCYSNDSSSKYIC